MKIEEMDKIVDSVINEDFYNQTIEELEQVISNSPHLFKGSALELSLKDLKETKKDIFLSSLKNLCYLLLFYGKDTIGASCTFHLTCFKEAGVATRHGFRASEATNLVIILTKDNDNRITLKYTLYDKVNAGSEFYQCFFHSQRLADTFTLFNKYFKVPKRKAYDKNFFIVYDIREAMRDKAFIENEIYPVIFPYLSEYNCYQNQTVENLDKFYDRVNKVFGGLIK